MASSYERLDQAFRDLLEAYTELEEEIDSKFSDDEDAFSHAVVEALEASIDSAVDELGSSPSFVASLLSNLSEALEQLDPSAFEDEEEEDEGEYNLEDVDIDYEEDEEEDEDEEGVEYEEDE